MALLLHHLNFVSTWLKVILNKEATVSAPFDKVWKDSDRDYWMTAQEAKEYGMIDEVLERKK